MAAFLLISTLLLMARGRDTDEDDEDLEVIEGSVEIDSDDKPMPATV
jgi:hypothetical protein